MNGSLCLDEMGGGQQHHGKRRTEQHKYAGKAQASKANQTRKKDLDSVEARGKTGRRAQLDGDSTIQNYLNN